MPREKSSRSVRLQPADPFDLIRWLARTQSDPRKAVAELVQNAIDANARRITVERRRMRGTAALRIRDDGEGVLPHLDREESLRHIATHIGYSHKRNLSPRERHEQVVAGKYGVGLLGFWAIGHRMEIRSRVAGSRLWVLRLTEDEQRADVIEQPLAIDAADTFTEVVILDLHEGALRFLGGRRLADYLAAELRGVLPASGAALHVHDAMARGLAQRRFDVVPPRFTGERLNLPAEVDTGGGLPPIRVELYVARGVERPSVQVSCSGTLVADDIGEMHSLGLDHPPWTGRDLQGFVDFGGFTVSPGTRRGVAPNAAALAFVEAMERLQPELEAELARLERERRAAKDRQVVHELRRALKGLARRLPHYELPLVANHAERVSEPAARGEIMTEEPEEAPAVQTELLPPGPLTTLRVSPSRVEVVPGSEHRVHALALDAGGRAIRQGVRFEWSVDGLGFEVRGEGPRPALAASADVTVGSQALLRVTARERDVLLQASAPVVAVEPSDQDTGGFGIPEPELVDEQGASWRSRYDGQRWQVNASHEDYVALRAEPRTRVRYLLALLAKEIVQRSYGAPGTDALLEHVVAILAHAERNLGGSSPAATRRS